MVEAVKWITVVLRESHNLFDAALAKIFFGRFQQGLADLPVAPLVGQKHNDARLLWILLLGALDSIVDEAAHCVPVGGDLDMRLQVLVRLGQGRAQRGWGDWIAVGHAGDEGVVKFRQGYVQRGVVGGC